MWNTAEGSAASAGQSGRQGKLCGLRRRTRVWHLALHDHIRGEIAHWGAMSFAAGASSWIDSDICSAHRQVAVNAGVRLGCSAAVSPSTAQTHRLRRTALARGRPRQGVASDSCSAAQPTDAGPGLRSPRGCGLRTGAVPTAGPRRAPPPAAPGSTEPARRARPNRAVRISPC